MPRYLYHWTTRLALASIRREGLDPSYATGKRKVVWMAGRRNLLWACCHASMHQRTDPDQMVCIRIRVAGLRLVRTAWKGVKTCGTLITPDRLEVCPNMLAGTWTKIAS